MASAPLQSFFMVNMISFNGCVWVCVYVYMLLVVAFMIAKDGRMHRIIYMTLLYHCRSYFGKVCESSCTQNVCITTWTREKKNEMKRCYNSRERLYQVYRTVLKLLASDVGFVQNRIGEVKTTEKYNILTYTMVQTVYIIQI